MGLDDDGFLSEEIEKVIESIREKYKDLFELAWKVNRYFQNLKFQIPVNNNDGQQVIAVCLIIKVFNDIQGGILLLERGLASQARSLIRVGIEGQIILANVCNSKEFFKTYVYAGEKEHLTFIKRMKNSTSYMQEDMNSDITDEMIDELARDIAEANVTKKTMEGWANNVNLKAVYDGAYRLFSRDIHSAPRAIENSIETDDVGTITTFSWGPEIKKVLNAEINAAILVMLDSMTYIDILFKLQIRDQLKKFKAELAVLDSQ